MVKKAKLRTKIAASLPEKKLGISLDPTWSVLSLIALAFVVYAPALTAGFTWDDGRAITNNPAFLPGHGLADIWAGRGEADFFPLKSTFLWLIYQFFGAEPSPYHIFNVAVHAVDAVLVWRVLRRLAIPGAWFAGLIFMVHPTHVESVAWISECKNTLSTLFGLLALLAWFDFDDKQRLRDYALALALFVCGLLCKTHIVILPLVLPLCAWWRRQHGVSDGTPGRRQLSKLQTVSRIAPFFVLAAVFAVITIWFQNTRAIAEYQLPAGGTPSRVANAGKATWWYLSKAISPTSLWYEMPTRPIESEPEAQAVLAGTRAANPAPALPIGKLTTWPLTMIYPRWRVTPPVWYDLLPAAAMLALFVWTAVHRNGRVRGAFFALAYFLVALLPILGLLKMSYMRAAWVADHFQYLADVGVIAFVCAGGALLWRRASPRRRCLLAAAASLLLVLFSTWSFLRAADYKDDYTLWADTVAKNPGTWQGQNRLGAELLARKEVQAATVHFAQAVRLKPDDADGHNNYGLGLASLGRFAESMEQFRASLQLQPAQFTAHANMGDALAQLKQPAEAAVEYKAALRYEPKLAPLHFRLAMVLLDSGKIDEAIASLEQAKALAPNSMEVLNALARATKKRAALR